MQIIGALDAARDLTVAHTSERVQFGRPLCKFQAVQHSLAEMAGEIERARAATELAITAATDFGFDSAATDYAVTVAKVATGRAVGTVTTIAHQLHGAIGVTVEHRLWLFTMRARSWVDDFGTTTHYARRLGRMALTADDPWQVSSAVQNRADPRLDVDAIARLTDADPLRSPARRRLRWATVPQRRAGLSGRRLLHRRSVRRPGGTRRVRRVAG